MVYHSRHKIQVLSFVKAPVQKANDFQFCKLYRINKRMVKLEVITWLFCRQ